MARASLQLINYYISINLQHILSIIRIFVQTFKNKHYGR